MTFPNLHHPPWINSAVAATDFGVVFVHCGVVLALADEDWTQLDTCTWFLCPPLLSNMLYIVLIQK